MTDPLSVGIALTAVAVAAAVGWVHWPRPPALDGERWFKMMLTTLLRGRVEADAGSVEAWEQAVLRFVPYHPAGRFPERKVANPRAAHLPGALLEGEQALLEALERLEDAPSRWARLYDDDEAAVAARLDDPQGLGEGYDPAHHLGPDAGWENLAAWGGGDPAFAARLWTRWEPAWVFVHGRPDRLVGPSLHADLEQAVHPRVLHAFAWEDGDLEARVASLASFLRERIAGYETRLVLVAEEAGLPILLRALEGAADLRDQLDAVLSIGGLAGGWPDEPGPFGQRDIADWMGAHFSQEALDSEVVRFTPWFSVQWLDRLDPVLGAAGLPLAASRLPEPREANVVATLESVDLGPLPVDAELPLELVARALVAVVGCWVLTRR